jgi:hypothetical protein
MAQAEAEVVAVSKQVVQTLALVAVEQEVDLQLLFKDTH